MIKKIAIGILIASVLAAFIITTVRIITKGSNRSEKPAAVINLSEILDSATIVGTYISNVDIHAGESISAIDLLNSAMGNPAEGTSDSVIVDLEHCSIFFESGQTSEVINKAGNSVLTVIASSKRTDQNYIYYVEINAGEQIVTQITTTGKTTSGSRIAFTTPPVKYYYDYTPKKTQAPSVTSGKKYTVSGSGYSTNISGIHGTGGSLPAVSVPSVSGTKAPVTKVPDITEKPDISLTQAPSKTEAAHATEPPETAPPAEETQPPVHESETDPPAVRDPEPDPDPQPEPEPDPVPDPEPDPQPQPDPEPEQPAE